MSRDHRRFPAVVHRHGGEPDARFTFANERTFLAWMRSERAMRPGEPLPSSLLAIAATVSGELIFIATLI